MYFSLKDDSSALRCFMPFGYAKNLRYELTDGMEVTAAGNISVFEKGGTYSLNVRDVDVSGAGELSTAFKALYEKLKNEGLFDEEYKKPLPKFPRKICVITAETGAAIRDILKIVKSKNQVTDILLYPCLVQGEHAASEIAAAIDDVNKKFPEVETIIAGRGGGSMEDLWAFNEEIVARSIFNSYIPVISAVGHETDFTIADYVADVRAETPTAAAAMAVPDIIELKEYVNYLYETVRERMERRITVGESIVRQFKPSATASIISNRIKNNKTYCEFLEEKLNKGIRYIIDSGYAAAEKQFAVIEASSPKHILNRGYAIVRSENNGNPLTTTTAVRDEKTVNLLMKDGEITLSIKSEL